MTFAYANDSTQVVEVTFNLTNENPEVPETPNTPDTPCLLYTAGTYLLIALVAVGAAAGGYYFKVYKPKHEYDGFAYMGYDSIRILRLG